MTTSDQERAAPAQQPAADDIVEKLFVDLRGRRYLKWIFSEHGDKCLIERAESGEWVTGISLDVQDEIRAEWRRIAASSIASSEPELRAEAAAKLQPVAVKRQQLIAQAEALLALDERGALVPHGIGGLARQIITALLREIEEPELRAEIVRLTRERDELRLAIAGKPMLDGLYHGQYLEMAHPRRAPHTEDR